MRPLFNRLVSSKQKKIVGIANKSGAEAPYYFYTKPWGAIVNKVSQLNFEGIKTQNKDLINPNFYIKDQRFTLSIEIGFEISQDVTYGQSLKFNDYVSNSFFVLNLTNQTLIDSGNKDNTGWFYGKEFDNSLLFITSLYDPLQFKVSLQEAESLEKPLNNKIIFGETKEIINIVPGAIESLTQAISLHEGDILLSGPVCQIVYPIEGRIKVQLEELSQRRLKTELLI